MINADKTNLWKEDVARSVDQFNEWFLEFAPLTFRETRVKTTERVEQALLATGDLADISPDLLMAHPDVLPVLRMCCAPPIARDRLSGLAGVSVVNRLEEGELPQRIAKGELRAQLRRICDVVARMLDRDIFSWLADGASATERERFRASTIVADRLCSAATNPIIRNAQEQRQLALIEEFLKAHGYEKKSPADIRKMAPGTFFFRVNVQVDVMVRGKKLVIPIDAVIQPKTARRGAMPVLIEAKSAGDFTNTNKRRKEEATKNHQLKDTFGREVKLILFLCGYFGPEYLGYEAAEGLDWVWEHRLDDLLQLGI